MSVRTADAYPSLRPGRHYIWKAVREANATCDRKAILAEVIERGVLDHLDMFLVDVEGVGSARRPTKRRVSAHSLPRQ
jgi:hypothetical protein